MLFQELIAIMRRCVCSQAGVITALVEWTVNKWVSTTLLTAYMQQWWFYRPFWCAWCLRLWLQCDWQVATTACPQVLCQILSDILRSSTLPSLRLQNSGWWLLPQVILNPIVKSFSEAEFWIECTWYLHLKKLLATTRQTIIWFSKQYFGMKS